MALITREQFECAYAERGGTTVEQLRALGRESRPCSCDERACRGWQMVNAREYDADCALEARGDGVEDPRGRAVLDQGN